MRWDSNVLTGRRPDLVNGRWIVVTPALLRPFYRLGVTIVVWLLLAQCQTDALEVSVKV